MMDGKLETEKETATIYPCPIYVNMFINIITFTTSVFFKEASATQARESRKSPANTATYIAQKKRERQKTKEKPMLRHNTPQLRKGQTEK